MQTDEAVSQAGHKVLVVVAWPEHQVAVDSQDPQGVQQGHLLSYRLVRSTELVEHGPVQTVVDGVEGKTLGTSLRLEEKEENKQVAEVRGEKRLSCVAVLWIWIKLLWKYFSRKTICLSNQS